MNDERNLDEALRDLGGAVEKTLSVHPDADLFLAHRRGDLAPQEAEALEEHVAWCRECAHLYREAALFAGGEAEPADPEEKRAAWEALEARLAEEEESPDEDATPPAPVTAPHRRFSPAIAALLAVALGGAGLWIAGLTGQLEDSRRPQANVPILDLSPREADRADAAPVKEVDPGRSALVVLNPRTPLEEGSYRARIVDGDGETVWTVEGLVPARFGTLNLQLPPRSLEPGDYELMLEAEGGGETLETFRLRVLDPARTSGS